MTEWLDRHVPGVVGTRVAEWLDQTMCGWYGLNMDKLSALNWIDFFVIPYPGGDERWHVRGGNDQIVYRAVATLPPSAVHVQTALRGVRRKRHGYELHFDGHRRVHCDLVILTLPFTTCARSTCPAPGSAVTSWRRSTSWRWASTPRCLCSTTSGRGGCTTGARS